MIIERLRKIPLWKQYLITIFISCLPFILTIRRDLENGLPVFHIDPCSFQSA